ncbi:hypothetical protein RUND412_007126 [Rhizina undulata]
MTTPKMAGTTPNSLGVSFASPALLGASPAAAAALIKHHRSPAASGLPHNFNSPEALAAIGLSLGGNINGVGVPLGMPGIQLPPDENKKRELADILRILALRPGRISEEGVERLAKRIGLECYKDTTPTGTMLSLAAKIFLLDIDFTNTKITRVALSFANTPGPSEELAREAEKILLSNLSPPQKRPNAIPLLNPSLKDFADNLERLAKTDRLSAPPHLNCFTAVTGIYRSLEKIFEHEKATMEGGEIAAMCKGIGRPRMHSRGKVGLSVDYWMERRHLQTDGEGEEKIWRVLLEVEEVPQDFANMNPITPVRTSDHWVSDEIKKPIDNLFGDPGESTTDWLEPPLEELLDLIPTDTPNSRPPTSRFVAKLDPPVIIPFAEETQLFNELMLNPPIGLPVDMIENLLFPNMPLTDGRERKIFFPVAASGMEYEDAAVHRYRLHSKLKPVFSRQLLEVPFSHPKELEGIFGILRQYVVVSTLLKSLFDSPGSVPLPLPGPATEENCEDEDDEDRHVDIDRFMADVDQVADPEEGSPLQVDVGIACENMFSIALIFPQRERLGNLVVHVGRNGEVLVPGLQLEAEGKGRAIDRSHVERAVDRGEDLGIVLEWVRRGGV